ncbi:MAG: hypothetical protein IT446_06230 [Phycisphaerales bacterium]|nr:hypothetical protein [Phycisphaerales bacterium]
MGIREKLNQNQGVTTGVTVGVIVLALIFIIWQLVGGNSRGSIPTQAFFTVDNGATWFADDIKKLPPFDHEGKQAVRAVVFRCKGGKAFVGHLERYSPEAKAQIEKMRQAMPASKDGKGGPPMPPPGPMMGDLTFSGMEVKPAGAPDTAWVKMSDFQKAQAVTKINCPDGDSKEIEPVVP